MTAKTSTSKNTIIVMLGTLFSRLSGIFRQQVINTFATPIQDAFNIASKIPNLLRELLAEGALVNSFIPVYKGLNPEEQQKLANAFSGVLLAVNLVILGVLLLLAPYIVNWLISPELVGNSTRSLDPEQVLYMTRLVLPFLMMISLAAAAMGILNAHEHFKATANAPVAFNLVTIVLMLLLPKTATVLGLTWVLGGLVQFLFQVPTLLRYGLMPRPSLKWHPALNRVLVLMSPFLLSSFARQFLNLVVVRLLTRFGDGAVSGYQNAETLVQTVFGLFAVSPAVAVYPKLSGYAKENNWQAFRQLTLNGVRRVALICAPIGFILAALSPQALTLFNIGAIDPNKYRMGWQVLSMWSLAILPWGMNMFLMRTFYAREQAKVPILITTFSAGAEISLYYLLVQPSVLGVMGFGVATAVSGYGVLIAILLMLRKQIALTIRPIVRLCALLIPVSLVAAGCAYAVATWVFPLQGAKLWQGVISGLPALVVGLVVYALLLYLLKLPEAVAIAQRFKRRS